MGHVRESLRLFRQLADETGSPEDAMWAVLQEDRRQREQVRRGRRLFDPLADAILDSVAAMWGLTRRELMAPGIRGRQGPHSHRIRARWVAMRALRDEGLSLPVIASHLGKRDHTTVMYGLARVADDAGLVDAATRARAVVRMDLRAGAAARATGAEAAE